MASYFHNTIRSGFDIYTILWSVFICLNSFILEIHCSLVYFFEALLEKKNKKSKHALKTTLSL